MTDITREMFLFGEILWRLELPFEARLINLESPIASQDNWPVHRRPESY